MSARAWRWAVGVRGVKKDRRATLLLLADHHNGDTGQCNPSVARLAALLECSERQVQRDLSWLEKHGLIRRSVHSTRGVHDSSSDFLLSLDRTTSTSPLGVTPTSSLGVSPASPKPEEEPQEEPQDALLSQHGGPEAMNYEELWGSSAEREAQRRADDQRQAKERVARVRRAALDSLPRSQWRPGRLEQFFRSQVLALGLPRTPQLDERGMRGAFQALLVNGHRPEELASAIEAFCADRTLWSDLVEKQGAPIWKVFIKLAPTIATRAGRAASSSGTTLPGWDF